MEEKATFGAGCFWGIENSFMKLQGVQKTRVGYSGGSIDKPTYESVCRGGTGHKEVVEVVFDTDQITYETLLKKFWEIHDPTTRDRQGLDFGEQYSSVIFYHNDAQKIAAEESKQALQDSGVYKNKVVTDITPAVEFYEAEEYHQKYIQKKTG